MFNYSLDYWEFENGIIVEGNGSDIFTVKRKNGDFLGHIFCGDYKDYIARVADLNNGIDPITGGWEDGAGNPCEFSGWGDCEE